MSFFIYTEKCNLTAQTLKSLIFYPKSKFSYIIAKLEKQKCIIFWEMELSILKNKSFYIYFSSSEFSRSKYYLSELSGEISISSAIYSGMYFSLTNTCLSILLTKQKFLLIILIDNILMRKILKTLEDKKIYLL